MSISFSEKDTLLLEKLNRRSWSHSFSPESDIDWDSTTTPEEYRSLYDAWSLLLGTRHEDALSDEQCVRFAKYQQMNLMMGTALFERYALANFESLYGDDSNLAYQEYVSHLIKEETYHYVLFARANECIAESDPELRALPIRPLKIYLAIVLFMLRYVPSRRMRHGMFFYLLRFIEEITLQANSMTKKTIARDDSLVLRVAEDINDMPEVRIPLGSGIAGAVAQTGRSIRIDDAYADPRFNQNVDKQTGYRTHSILSLPVKDSSGHVFAVAQLLNRKDGQPFDQGDEQRFANFIQSIGVILETLESLSVSKATAGRQTE